MRLFDLVLKVGRIFFFSKTYKFHQQCMKHGWCRQSFYLENLSVSLLCGSWSAFHFMFSVRTFDRLLTKVPLINRNSIACDCFSTFLKIAQGTKDTLMAGTKVILWMHEKGKTWFLRHKPGVYYPVVSTNKQAVHLKEWEMWIVGIWKCDKLRPDFSIWLFMGQI